MCQEDADYVRGKARVIAINSTYKLALWADVLYGCDAKWWKKASTDHKNHPTFKEFRGLRFALTTQSAIVPGVRVLKNTGTAGLETNPIGLKTGRNSGFQAVNLAYHLGGTRILLLGYDMGYTNAKQQHWHEPDFPGSSPYAQFRQSFETIVQPLQAAGVELINCSRETALTCVPRMSLRDALPVAIEVAA
jgi:hypothetical protein